MIHNFDIDDFLKNYWQQKPLLIRAAFPEFKSPITPDELAGLACEEDVESRIILETNTSSKWQLEKGPFAESRFTQLPGSHWTLLIQGLNKLIPEFDDLLHQFNFIPSWRVDDLMASYAAPGGSVGPHTDQYDVFLLQASGRRKWMISEKPFTEDDFIANIPLKILREFAAESEWVLEAGDMLYLPPNVAHYGIGMDDCMTFSIGFRAPSHADMLTSYVDEHITTLFDNQRYRDNALTTNNNPGEISQAAINNIKEILLSQFSEQSNIEDWFGRFITDYLNDHEEIDVDTLSVDEFLEQLEQAGRLRRLATVRANYLEANDGVIKLFINGSRFDYAADPALVKLVCNQHLFEFKDISSFLDSSENLAFICELYNQGYVEFDDE